MKRRAAELTKYAANAFLATKISFINEIADLCEKVRADVHDVAEGIGLDSRIGARFLQPGPGYGGSCFPKDTLALLKTGQDCEAPLRIVEAVVASNDSRKRSMGRKVVHALGGDGARQDGRAARADLQGQHRRHARFARRWRSSARCRMPGATVRAYDPEGHGAGRQAARRRDLLRATPTRRWTGPTRR